MKIIDKLKALKKTVINDQNDVVKYNISYPTYLSKTIYNYINGLGEFNLNNEYMYDSISRFQYSDNVNEILSLYGGIIVKYKMENNIRYFSLINNISKFECIISSNEIEFDKNDVFYQKNLKKLDDIFSFFKKSLEYIDKKNSNIYVKKK